MAALSRPPLQGLTKLVELLLGLEPLVGSIVEKRTSLTLRLVTAIRKLSNVLMLLLLVAVTVAVAELVVLIRWSLRSLISVVIHNDASSLLMAVNAGCHTCGKMIPARRCSKRCSS